MWGSPESIQEVKALIQLIESVQHQQAAGAGGAGATGSLDRPPLVSSSSAETSSQPT